jgi:hypothetical protein
MRLKDPTTEDVTAEPEPRAPEPATPQLFSREGLIALQRSAGNQAMGRMLARFADTAVRERASQVGDWVDAKIQVRAYEIHKETDRGDEQANYFQAKQEVEAAWQHLLSLEAGTMISVDEWVLMKRGLSNEEYFRALRAFNDWTGPADVKEKFLEDLPQDKLYLFTDALARRELGPGETIEGQIRGSANPERAKRAQRELRPIANQSKAARARLTDKLFALLVWGVAYARSADPTGGEGLIGVHHAVEAAHALVEMPKAAYIDTVLQLDLTGGEGEEGNWDQRRVESVLLLKAVAARRGEYQTAPEDARDAVSGFAGQIRGEDTDTIVDWTTLRDSGGGGLQQRFTMTCGPTTIQIVTGEGDPIYAIGVAAIGKHGLAWENDIGDAQEAMLGKAVAPRLLKDRWDDFQSDIGGLAVTPAEAAEWGALLDWMAGVAADPALLAAGRAHANALGYTDDELDNFEKYQIGLTTEPGLLDPELDVLVNNMPAITSAGATAHAHPAANPLDDAALDAMWRRLFRGEDLVVGVTWAAGGGHVMSLQDAKGRPPTGGPGRQFLLSDPWAGTSEWLTGDQLKAGDFGAAGNGIMDLAYY